MELLAGFALGAFVTYAILYYRHEYPNDSAVFRKMENPQYLPELGRAETQEEAISRVKPTRKKVREARSTICAFESGDKDAALSRDSRFFS